MEAQPLLDKEMLVAQLTHRAAAARVVVVAVVAALAAQVATVDKIEMVVQAE